MQSLSRRRSVLAAAAAGGAALIAARAAAHPGWIAGADGQVPGVHRWRVGGIVVTAIADGYADMELAVVPNADPAAAERLAHRAFAPAGHLQCVVNTFVVQTPTRRVMIDTGFGRLGTGVDGTIRSGRIWANLRAAGIAADSIDALVVTHGHPDHISGMLGPDGAAAFARAELFIHAREIAYWSDEARASRAPAAQRARFDLFRRSVAAYRERITVVDRDGQEVVPGLRIRELFGHTPGHVGVHIADAGEQHLMWTDIVHFQHLQLRHPEWGVGFDVDPDTAARVRRALFDEATADRLAVSGVHLLFPGFGHVRRDGPAYALEPARWTYDL